jgi:serine/threonine protein kinase
MQKKKDEVDIKDVKSLVELKIEKELGEGAFGVVHLITQGDKKYALKAIDKDKIIR